MTRTFYAKQVNPEAEHADSDDDAPPPPARHDSGGAHVGAVGHTSGGPRGSSARRASSALAPTQSVEPDDDVDMDAAGPSGSVDGDSGSARGGGIIKRGSYMKNGPTVYKLVKPVFKNIKEAKAKE